MTRHGDVLDRTGLLVRRTAGSGVVLGCLLAVTGCSSSAEPPSAPPPATLQAIPGSPVHRVVLSSAGAASLQLQTTPVQEVDGREVIPMTAVIYDPKGAPWAYTVVAPRSYVRQAIVIDHVTDGQATLVSGPPAGSTVVTVGAPELLGAEYGVGEE